MSGNPEDSVSLPSSFDVRPPHEFEATARDFCGIWAGEFGERQRHVLIVEKPLDVQNVQIIMATADSALYGAPGGWWRLQAQISGSELIPQLPAGWHAKARYQRTGSDRLICRYRYDSGFHHIGIVERTSLLDGKPVRFASFGTSVRIPSRHGFELEGALYLPSNKGAKRLAVFSHGSAVGADRLRSWREPLIAFWLLDHGYAVLVPMRRGRGGSAGVYVEDSHVFDDSGTPVDITPSIAAALEDLEDAAAFGRSLPGLERERILHLGQSRGGFLAAIHAGRRPDEVSGVINFVGGWMGGAAAGLNTPWFAAAGKGAGRNVPQLWIYSAPDQYYGEAHTRENFGAFCANGGSAELIYHTGQPPFDGHGIRFYPDLWRERADAFLRELA